MELKVEEIKELEPIKFNYEDLKKWVITKTEEYKSIVYTDETIVNAKEDRATLNKVFKALNDEKIRIKKEILKPFEDFEKKCKELQEIVKDASNSVDKQIKTFEEKEQEEKKKIIQAIYDNHIGDFKELIKLDTIFNPRWLNKTYSDKKIDEDINHIIVKTTTDLKVIDGQISDENIKNVVKNYYFQNITEPSILGMALQKGAEIEKNNERLEQLKKIQTEKEMKENTAVINKENSTENKEESKMQINFSVIATREQFVKIKEFFVNNKIDYRRI